MNNPLAYVLREAAHHARTTAAMAETGTWDHYPQDPIPDRVVLGTDIGRPVATTHERSVRGYNAAHITAWSPPVAEAIAALWDQIADTMDDQAAEEREHPHHAQAHRWLVVDHRGEPRDDWTAALRAARVFLRRPTCPQAAIDDYDSGAGWERVADAFDRHGVDAVLADPTLADKPAAEVTA